MTLTELLASARAKVSPDCTTAGWSDAKCTAALNEWYRIVLGWHILAGGIWKRSGEMYTADLVNGQDEYVLPVGLIIIERIELKYSGSTQYVKATRIDNYETDESFKNKSLSGFSTGTPGYRMFDGSVFLSPTPTADSADGFYLEGSIDITNLSGSSDIPDLNPLIHRAVAMGAAMDYLNSKERFRQANAYLNQLMGSPGGSTKNTLKSEIEDLAMIRDMSVRPKMDVRNESFD